MNLTSSLGALVITSLLISSPVVAQNERLANTPLSAGELNGLSESFRSEPVNKGQGIIETVEDGSFEDGSPNSYWNEYSLIFGTPLCTAGFCGTGGGTTGPHSGEWWAWFGGSGTTEEGSVGQTVFLPSGEAHLDFWMWIGTCPNSTDYFEVTIDGNTVFETLADVAACDGGYILYTVDVSEFADGDFHDLEFYANESGVGGTTNWSLDDVSIITIIQADPVSTLSAQNLAILAFLMLGLGFVAIRRFA